MKENDVGRFIKNLQRVMKERGIDVSKLSEMTDIPVASLERILGEISDPNQAAMERIADRLGILLQELAGAEPIESGPDGEETVEAFPVTPSEKSIIEAYRKLPEDHWLRKAIEENLLDKSE
jgi:transcriptional regulator with XRE-family HTH domain